ncbi:MAG: hypoxanthine phosphoribosyltransferase [Peptococcaceae bacterium]|nr:hypoxanthine phosphoribosyltransferase [Peptococcaceae bacterium]
MESDVQKVLLTADEINSKVLELGRQITQDYVGQNLLVVGILKGAVVFMSDLIRQIKTPHAIDFMAVSSYGVSTESSGVVRIMKDLERSIENVNILIVEDIIDTGLTLKYLVENLRARNPLSVRVCTLLDKASRRKVDIAADYNGFAIPDEFVVGYGLDYNERFRHLPYVGVLKPAAYGGK